MKSKLLCGLFALLISATLVRADISMPVKDNFYDKLGRGMANITLAPSEILDSIYTLNQLEGPTVAWSKGLVQGVSRAIMDIANGTVDTVTAPVPIACGTSYRSVFKQHPYDSMVVNEYPPGDLKNFY